MTHSSVPEERIACWLYQPATTKIATGAWKSRENFFLIEKHFSVLQSLLENTPRCKKCKWSAMKSGSHSAASQWYRHWFHFRIASAKANSWEHVAKSNSIGQPKMRLIFADRHFRHIEVREAPDNDVLLTLSQTKATMNFALTDFERTWVLKRSSMGNGAQYDSSVIGPVTGWPPFFLGPVASPSTVSGDGFCLYRRI